MNDKTKRRLGKTVVWVVGAIVVLVLVLPIVAGIISWFQAPNWGG